jgi:ATP-binding cassette, subfamily B, bacterial
MELERDHPHASFASWRDALGLCARYWVRQPRLFAGVIALSVAGTAAYVAIPVAAGQVVDALTLPQGGLDQQAAFAALFLMTGVMLTHFVLRDLSTRLWNRKEALNMKEVLDEGFARVQRFSSDWHANTFAGATVRKLTRGKWAYEHISDIIWMQFFPLALTLIGLTIVLAARYPAVAAVFAGVTALYIIVSVAIALIYVRPANVKAAAADSALGGAVADAISNNAAVKAFGAETREEARFATTTERWRGLALRSWRRGLDMALAQQMLWAGLQFAMLALLIGAVARGEARPGDVAFVIAANFQLGGNLRQMGDHIRMLQRAIAEFGDLVAFDRAPLGVADAAAAEPFAPRRGEIVFDAVGFAYPGSAPLYEAFDLRIAPGERVGLVGPSGSGKSTFVKLIQRLYDVQDGVIWIDGQDAALVEQASLRRAIAIVPQEPVLFHRSLSENIAYGRREASPAQIKEAARRARAHDFIIRLPKAYDTLVGERGVKLSGGERQRVAIARAFLADAPIVIFDEATSSLDTIAEKGIQAAMAELMAGRTTILIAHRLSTVKHCDRILVFDHGRIVESGDHAALMARPDGVYRRLHEVQGEEAIIG